MINANSNNNLNHDNLNKMRNTYRKKSANANLSHEFVAQG